MAHKDAANATAPLSRGFLLTSALIARFKDGDEEKQHPGNTRSNPDSLKSNFLTAHSGTIPHRTVSRLAVRVP
jgi:hypothetical protein